MDFDAGCRGSRIPPLLPPCGPQNGCLARGRLCVSLRGCNRARGVPYASRDARGLHRERAGIRGDHDRMDPGGGGFRVRDHGGDRLLQSDHGLDRLGDGRPSSTSTADRFCLRRSARRFGRRRRSGGSVRCDADRARVSTVRRRAHVPAGEHCPSGVGRHGKSHSHTGRGNGTAGRRCERDGRPDSALDLGDPAVLARKNPMQLAGHVSGLAGTGLLRSLLRVNAILLVELHGFVARRYHGRLGHHRPHHDLPEGLETEVGVALSGRSATLRCQALHDDADRDARRLLFC